MDYQELNPRNSTFVLQGETYTLKPFTLAAQVWSAMEFSEDGTPENGLNNIVSILRWEKGDFNTFADLVAKIAFKLCHEAGEEIPSLCAFKKMIAKDERGTVETIKSISRAVSESIGNSQPHYDEAAERVKTEQLKKKLIIRAAKNSHGQVFM